ncbi:MAG: biopolymer transporter ExbD [Spirochaetes bacterium]|nr:biopolymer transporter ExbD [Spirochaetota bacterium]
MRLERRLKPLINVDLTPLIDVIFQLVIFFMITSTFRTAPGIPLDLPEAGSAEPVSVSEIRITVVSEREIYLDGALTDSAGLPALVSKRLIGLEGSKPRILLEGDGRAPYELVVSVLDVLRANGIEGVDLLTRARASP